MATLALNAPRVFEVGDGHDIPVIASDIIYEGAAVGDNASGYARPLVAGDLFLGFALEKADNASGSAGDKKIKLSKRGAVELSITGAVITDVGQPVYASDDDTFVFLPTGNSYVGKIIRWVSAGKAVVAYDIDNQVDPYGDGPRETISVNKTLDGADTGKTFFVDTDAKIITLSVTATVGTSIKIVNIGADGAVAVNVDPAATDKVQGPDLAGTDNKDHINTKATARRGDYVVITAGHADGWAVDAQKGIWATEA